jgi:hypothetical protein
MSVVKYFLIMSHLPDEICSLFLCRIWMWFVIAHGQKCFIYGISIRVSTNFYHGVNLSISPLI